MIIEQSTNYAYKLKYMDNPTFDKVRDLAIKFMRELPKQLQDELYEALNRGVDILGSEPQMVTYLYAFGPMHQAKLNYAFKHLPEEFLEQPEINIIDYGCGQALGTMCYADYLRENGYAQKVKTITLIEPSEMCLKRAALHTSVFFADAEIKTVNKSFDELDKNDICCDEDIPTLHIFSNVLDILDFDLEGFSDLIKGQLKGYNQFVCVGPFFNYSDKDERMDVLFSLFDGKRNYRESFDKYEFDPEKTWTAKILCFSKGELIGGLKDVIISTEVKEEELEDAVEDEYGLLYSKDGKRLLKCKNFLLDTCIIKDGTMVICDKAFHDFWNRGVVLRQIVIPNSVKIIGNYAFSYCESLKQIVIPNSVTIIGESAFASCGIRKLTIPQSVTRIGDNPLWGCTVDLKNDSKLFVIKNQMLIERKENRLIAYFGHEASLSIPDSVKCIGGKAFKNCKTLRKIIIPNSVDTIGDRAFEACSSLQQITIPQSVVSIGHWSFSCCESLKTVFIANSVTFIGNGAFHDCNSLRQVTIPDNVTTIGDEVFEGCESLEYIYLPESVDSIGIGAFAGCNSLKQISIPKTVISVGEEVFEDCSSLQTITIPRATTEEFKKMFDEELWDKLYECGTI